MINFYEYHQLFISGKIDQISPRPLSLIQWLSTMYFRLKVFLLHFTWDSQNRLIIISRFDLIWLKILFFLNLSVLNHHPN